MPFQPFTQPLTAAERYAQEGENAFRVPPSGSPDSGGIGGAAGEAFDMASKVAVGVAAYKAGQNHYQQSGDLGQSIQVGAVAYVRWMVLFLAAVAWVSLFLINSMNGNLAAGMRADSNAVGSSLFASVYLLGISPFLFGVNWCRNSDFCLFRRGPVYRLYAPIAQVVEVVPTWALYALLIPPVVL